MVLESLVNPWKAEKHPKVLLPFGFIYVSIGIFLSLVIFPGQGSLISVFLTTMAVIPLVYNIIKMEEKKDTSKLDEKHLLKEHFHAIMAFFYFFLGAVLSYAFWYVVLSKSYHPDLFGVQLDTIRSIRSNITGNAYAGFQTFMQILVNNVKVLIFCILFSFLYGVGGIFILTWNASVIGVAIGSTIRSSIAQVTEKVGLNYASAITYGLLRYSIHGIPEILSYFVAGLAGGIISSAIIKHDFGSKNYLKIITDSSVLILISFFLVVISAFLEVYITPLIF